MKQLTIVDQVNTKVQENRQFTISVLALEYLQVSIDKVYGIATKLNYHKLYARQVPKMLTDISKIKG